MEYKKKIPRTSGGDNLMFGKVPPQSKDCEEAVLGAILLEKNAFSIAYDIIKHFHFYLDSHQEIFKACQILHKKHLPIDLMTVVEQLRSAEKLDLVGGPYAVTKLTNVVVSSANIEAHSRIILQKFVSREIIRVSGESIGEAYEDSTDPFDLLDSTSEKIKEINLGISETSHINIGKISMKVVSDIETKAYNAENNIEDDKSIYTGITEWDKINGSLFPGGLYIIAARPAMGKGVHMTQCIANMGKKYEIGVVNAEMTNQQLITRVGCNLLSIDNHLWKKDPRDISKDELQTVYDAMEATSELSWRLDDKKDVNKVCNKIKLWVERDGVQCVFADVLSKFRPPEELIYRMTDVQKLNYVMDAFSQCALDNEIPIILYAHLNRELYKRQNKEPNLSDLKGSGNIEDFAFQVSLLHRPEYYDINEDEFGESTKGLMYQIIAKHREGEVGRLKQHFLPQFSQLKKWETYSVPGWQPTVGF